MSHQTADIEVGSLRHRLKTGTKEIHDVADKAMRSFLFENKETTTVPAYRHFLLQIRGLYEAMEAEMERNRLHPAIGPIHFPQELNRVRLLELDLDYYYKGQWRDLYESNLTPAMRRYIARVKEVGKTKPELLVAHSYTRYLGDMSGGQILKKMIQKRYDIKGDDGVSFYSFEHIESIAKFKELYSARMNSLDLTESQRSDIIEEAKRIFQFNIDVFKEVADRFADGVIFNEVLCQKEMSLATWKWDSNYLTKVSLAVAIPMLLVVFSPWLREVLLKH